MQYRINGIQLPDGVGSFGQIVDSGIVGSLALITGAMPAQFGLRTAGVVDIQTKQSAFDNTGTVSVYGGSRGTITPSFEYGGTAGQTQYFVSGRFFASDIGLENPTSANTAIHDHTDQGKGFAYVSTVIDPSDRLTFMSGVASSSYQIPNNPGQTPAFTAFGISNFNSADLNQNQNEFNQFNVLALQHSAEGLDLQTAYFNRTSIVHFMPDPIGDLIFNGVASDVYRQSVVNGIQTDASYRIADAHTLRAGFTVSAEQTLVNNFSSVFAWQSRLVRRPIIPVQHLRFQQQDRLPVRHLCRGRMEDQQPAHAECGPALRPDGAICQRQPVQPAHQPDLSAVRGHDLPRRLCPLFHPAAAGAGGADQPRAGAAARRSSRRSMSPIRCCRNDRTTSMSA